MKKNADPSNNVQATCKRHNPHSPPSSIYSVSPSIGFGALVLQGRLNGCLAPALAHIDTLIAFLVAGPLLTVIGFFGLAELISRFVPHSRYEYYLANAASVCFRVSSVLVLIGLFFAFFVIFLAPDWIQACSRYGDDTVSLISVL